MYLEIGGDFNYTDSTTGGTQDTNATMDYTLYNARITLGDEEGKWSAQLWSHNITDEYYYPSAFVANGPFVRMVGMPRTVGATVAYYW
jgi:iron complex outermembrane receptor protein